MHAMHKHAQPQNQILQMDFSQNVDNLRIFQRVVAITHPYNSLISVLKMNEENDGQQHYEEEDEDITENDESEDEAIEDDDGDDDQENTNMVSEQLEATI